MWPFGQNRSNLIYTHTASFGNGAVKATSKTRFAITWDKHNFPAYRGSFWSLNPNQQMKASVNSN